VLEWVILYTTYVAGKTLLDFFKVCRCPGPEKLFARCKSFSNERGIPGSCLSDLKGDGIRLLVWQCIYSAEGSRHVLHIQNFWKFWFRLTSSNVEGGITRFDGVVARKGRNYAEHVEHFGLLWCSGVVTGICEGQKEVAEKRALPRGVSVFALSV
jgi:hypothetical protein